MSPNASSAVALWLPALGRFDASHPVRRMLLRANRNDDGARGYIAGLAAYFDCPGGLPVAALTRELLAGDAADANWLCADPAWIQPDLNGARLLACGQMGLDADEAEALARPLKPLFGDVGMLLEVSSPDRWHLRLEPQTLLPDFATPEQAMGEDLYEHLPQGQEGRRWRAVFNEVQVILHQHPVNAARSARGLVPINSLWLWGAGRLPDRVRTTLTGAVGDDLLLGALSKRAGLALQPRNQTTVAAALPGWLIDMQDLSPEAILAYAPTLDALSRRQPLQWHFASGERWLHRPLHRWRLWRRSAG